MNKLVTTAIVGTGQQTATDLSTGTAVDALTRQLPPEQPERSLLLAAGAWALYQQAGYTVHAPQLSQQPAPAEQQVACSSKVAHIISGFLQGRHDILLSEALKRLQRAQQRLSHELLPQALAYGTSHKQFRTALLAVLGQRGRWLAQFIPEWSWATSTDTGFMNKSLADIEALWQEQTLLQRVEILRYVRTIEPDTARAWLIAVWKQEKADARASLLSALEVNPSPQDEEFLEQALNDRGKNVCAQAIDLLAAIPTSAFNQRMQERADASIDYTNGSLQIKLQGKFDPSWRRDGITQDNKYKSVIPASILQVISRVSPAHWEERFGASPALLVEAANASKWPEYVVKGWTIAAGYYSATAWFEPLLAWWAKHASEDSDEYLGLFRSLPQDRAEQHILAHLFDGTSWIEELVVLPRPWSSSFSRACLQKLQQNAAELAKTSSNDYTYYYKSTDLINAIATALPPDCFDIALAEWTFSTNPKDNNWYVQHWAGQISNLQTLLRLRQKIHKEIF
jgi:hypothetical protein